MKIALVALMLISIAPGLAQSGVDRAGTTAANFLSVGSGPAALGMGGATLGMRGGLGLASWNTGSLGWLDETEMSISHAGLAEQSSQEFVGIGGRFGHTQTHWALSGLYQGEGGFAGRDASGLSTGDFKVASMAAGAQVAQRFGNAVSVGVGGKWVNDDLGVMRGSGFTFDGGVLAQKGMFGFGVAAQNVGGRMRYGSETYDFPANYGAGVSVTSAKTGLRADLDMNFPSAYYKNVRGGLEWQWKEHLALRGGYRAELGGDTGDALAGPTFGMGAGAYGLWFDYGYVVSGNGESTHRLGISLRPGHMNLGDPFGQKQMPREFDTRSSVGPPAPATSAPAKKADH